MRPVLLLAFAMVLPTVASAQSAFSAAPELEVPVRKAEAAVRPAQPVSRAPGAEAGVPGLDSGAVFRPGDTFELRLSGMPAEDSEQFRQAFTIGTDGYLSIPLAGRVRAAGLTQSQLERAIEQKLIAEEIFRFPTATINVAPQARFVTVGGQVRNPNRFQWAPDLTLLTALSSAGGGGDFAGDKVELIRGGKMLMFSIKKLRKDPTQDPKLMPGDRIEQR